MAQRIIRIQQSLKVAAEAADINGLYGSIKEDPLVLDRIDAIPFVDTPLHIAASVGHSDFAIEILRLKPSFGRKLNPDGLSSLHLALISDKFETVKRLIDFDKELIRVKGREGANSLHLIAKKDINADQQQTVAAGRIDILAEFLFACPNSIEDLTNRNETALHIALKTENQRAVQVILGCICRIGREEVFDYVNVEGKNAFDMAESTSPLEIVSSLRRAGASSVWWIQIGRSLRSAGALECSSPDPSLAEFLNSPERPWEVLYKLIIPVIRSVSLTELRNIGLVVAVLIATATYQKVLSPLEKLSKHIIRARRSVSMELRNMGLVVAVLIATTTYQAVLSPPGGVGGPGNNNLLTPSNGNFLSGFYCLNTLAFVLSMLMIMFALAFQPFFPLLVALYFLMGSYGFSFSVISPSNGSSKVFLIVSLVCAVLIFSCRFVIYQTNLKLKRNAGIKRLQMLERLLKNVEQ